MEKTIGGIKVSAPLWNQVPELTLVGIVALLSRASYHYADDSAKEWGKAKELVDEAAFWINKYKLSFGAIEALHKETPQLVDLASLIDAVLKGARQ